MLRKILILFLTISFPVNGGSALQAAVGLPVLSGMISGPTSAEIMEAERAEHEQFMKETDAKYAKEYSESADSSRDYEEDIKDAEIDTEETTQPQGNNYNIGNLETHEIANYANFKIPKSHMILDSDNSNDLSKRIKYKDENSYILASYTTKLGGASSVSDNSISGNSLSGVELTNEDKANIMMNEVLFQGQNKTYTLSEENYSKNRYLEIAVASQVDGYEVKVYLLLDDAKAFYIASFRDPNIPQAEYYQAVSTVLSNVNLIDSSSGNPQFTEPVPTDSGNSSDMENPDSEGSDDGEDGDGGDSSQSSPDGSNSGENPQGGSEMGEGSNEGVNEENTKDSEDSEEEGSEVEETESTEAESEKSDEEFKAEVLAENYEAKPTNKVGMYSVDITNNWKEPEIIFDNVKLTLPCSAKKLMFKGYEVTNGSWTDIIQPNTKKTIKLEHENGTHLRVTLMNDSSVVKEYQDCDMTYFLINMNNCNYEKNDKSELIRPVMYLPCGASWEVFYDSLKEAWGLPYNKSTRGGVTDATWIYQNVTIRIKFDGVSDIQYLEMNVATGVE